MSDKFYFNCLKVSAVALFMLLLQPANGQQNFKELEQSVVTTYKNFATDVIMTIATKDTIIYQKAPKLFTVKTQVDAGQASQWFTAALIMVLVDEGKLSLDDKVSNYLPVFEKYGKNYITLRHCLTHFTGIQSETKLKLFDKKKWNALEDEVAAYAAKEINTNRGTEFRYSLIGPAIAARVAEVVMKKRFDLLVQQKLFRPLGMRQTTFSTPDASAISASAGARTTANDYTRFLRMLLNNGLNNGQRILSEQAITELRAISAIAGAVKGETEQGNQFGFAAGTWAAEQKANEATVLVAPGQGGSLAIVDFCRGYAFLLLVKKETETKSNNYTAIKKELDDQFKAACIK